MTKTIDGASRNSTIGKPPRPYADFPLGPANNGRWQKRIGGRLFYFGRWGRIVNGQLVRIQPDGCWQEALAIYKAQVDTIRQTGEAPRRNGTAPGRQTVMALCNEFLTSKLRKLQAHEIAPRTFTEYWAATALLINHFGKQRVVESLVAADFGGLRAKMTETCGPVRLANEIGRIKTVFKWAFDNGLIERPVRYGTEFQKPSRAVLRRHRAKNGQRMLTPAEIAALVKGASVSLRAMILLGLNCGFGNADCSNLPLSAVNLDHGWISFPRPKTGIARECPLWPETVAALRAVIAERPEPKTEADADIVFLTMFGNRWVRSVKKSIEVLPGEEANGASRPLGPIHTPVDSVGLEFRKLLKKLHIQRCGFYQLRHTFRTVADEVRDQPAARQIMGHADASIDDAYRDYIRPARLRAVTDHVRAWLNLPAPAPAQEGGAS
jgi:integrase